MTMLTVLTLASTATAQSKYDSWNENFTSQALLGAVQYDNLKLDAPNSAGQTEIDISLLPQLGGAWSTLPKGDRLQVGLETSFLLGFRFDKINYIYAGSGGTYISLSTSMWMFDLAGGGYVNLFLDEGKKVRLYAGGGPLMLYADYRTDADYSNSDPSDSNHESAFGIGAYARTGFEFRVAEKGMLGLGARGTWANVDLSDAGGSSSLSGVALFATYTAGF